MENSMILKVNHHQLERIIPICATAGVTLGIVGQPGSGKSYAVHKATKNMEVAIFVVPPSTQPEDVKGIPFPDSLESPDSVVYLTDELLPKGDDYGVLFWDEADRYPKETRQTMLNLLGEGFSGSYHLPKGVFQILAINGDTDSGTARLDQAFRQRVCWVYLEPTDEERRAFAADTYTSPLSRYVQDHTDRLTLQYWEPSDQCSDYSNLDRQMAQADKLYAAMIATHELHYDIIHPIFQGVLGAEASAHVMATVRQSVDVPTADQIELDPVGASIPSTPEGAYAAAALAGAIGSNGDERTDDAIQARLVYVSRLPDEARTAARRMIQSAAPRTVGWPEFVM